jgi:hypothetical protein
MAAPWSSGRRRGERCGRQERSTSPGAAFGAVAPDPLVDRGTADAELLCYLRRRPALHHHPAHQQLAAEHRQTRVRMSHESLLPVWDLAPLTVQ